MKILIFLPTWLGDAIMASAAIRHIVEHFRQKDAKAHFIMYGSFVSCELFKECENTNVFVEDKKHRFRNFYKLSKTWGKIDCAFSFRGAFSAKILLFMARASHKFCFDKRQNKDAHQVLKYLYFTEQALQKKTQNTALFLPIPAFKNLQESEQKTLCEIFSIDTSKKLLGINAGAKYGSAKRWDETYFAKVALHFANTHQILIFGVASESQICKNISQILKQNGVNALNLCAKTSIKELCELISMLDLFISNDSGAMHIGAVYQTPTIALFGPTKFTQTSPWGNENARLVHLNLPCMPCMKRTCPLKHHKCMQDLKPEFVIKEAENLVQKS